jgi:hypothetical protein
MNPDYHEQCGPEFTSREHELFATALANIPLDTEVGFICGAAELEVLYRLSVAMSTHSPHGKGWERLGMRVFQVIEAQRAGDLDAELVEAFYRARAALTDDGLPDGPVATATFSDDEESPGEDVVSVEGGYVWHTDGRPPEPVQA